jgi:CubicO group peptidase (beta-lactamase class C family)
MRDRVLLILKFLVLVFGICIFVLIRESLPIISGDGAKVLCSGVFLAGRNPEEVIKDDLAGFPLSLGSYTVDKADSSVTATVWGMALRKAVYRHGLGATLLSGIAEEELREQRIERAVAPVVDPDTVDWPLGDRLAANMRGGDPLGVGPGGAPGYGTGGGTGDGAVDGAGGGRGEGSAGGADTAALRVAVGMAFGDGAARVTGTRAVIVVRHGRIIAERYAAGFDRHTRLAGWSMAKGVTNALIGILVKQGKLNIFQPAPVDNWQQDDRSKITLANLLHMNSGLKWWEFYGGPSNATQMLFKERDMGRYAAESPSVDKPGEVFQYSSGTANILSFIIRQTVGERGYHRFPYEQLFYRTGMYSAVLEPDGGGTFVGSSYCYATARDWARFGLLYLQDGVWNGQRILPEGWVDFTRTGDSYGALWWLNKSGRHPHMPEDCFACEGYEGQYIWVIPSKDLVLVRLAMEKGRRLDPDKFVPAVVGALR